MFPFPEKKKDVLYREGKETDPAIKATAGGVVSWLVNL